MSPQLSLFEEHTSSTLPAKPLAPTTNYHPISQRTTMSNLNLHKRKLSAGDINQPSKKIRAVGSTVLPRIVSYDGDLSRMKCNPSADVQTSRALPQRFLMTVLKTHLSNVTPRPSLNLNGFFLEYTEEMFDSYGRDVITAVQNQDLDELRRIHASEGRTLQCANRFGESILHMACRRGFTDVVRFLIKEAGVSPRVRDDMGRTPMHDACWTCNPDPDLMELLMEECPELLVLKDRRGSAPFEYTRLEHAEAWSAFLQEKQEIFSQKDVIDRIQAVQVLLA